MKIAIIDDDIKAITLLKDLLSDYPDFEIVGTSTNGTEGLKMIKETSPNLLFLDI